MSENKKQNLDDFNNEIAGRDTGRIKRFLSQSARDHLDDNKEQKSQEKLSLLDILLLTDPVYTQLYSDVMEKIEEIDRAVNKALSQTEQRINSLEERLAGIQEKAYRLPDGTLVYQSKNGEVFTDDGILVSEQELTDMEWDIHHPSWEERREVGDALSSAHKKKEEIEEYRDGTLQHAKDRMNDRDNPPDKEELQDIFDNLNQRVPKSIQDNLKSSNDIEKQSCLVKGFNNKASGQEETQDAELSANQPTLTQEADLSQNRTVVTP